MKKNIIIASLFSILIILSFYSFYTNERNIHDSNLTNLCENDFNTNIIVSADQYKQEDIYHLFKLYMDKFEGSYCFSNISTVNGKKVHVKYIYFSNSDIFKSIKLSSGRIYSNSENESKMFLSTNNTNSPLQIGQIADFSGDSNFDIRTIKSCKINDIFQRIISVQFKNEELFNKFIDGISTTGIKIQKKFDAKSHNVYNTALLNTIIFIFFIIILLIQLYSLFNSYKAIAVEKMMGFRNMHIWFKRISYTVCIQVLLTVIISTLLIYINFKAYNQYFFTFLQKLSGVYLIMIVLSIVFLSFPFLYVKKISISNMIKNKKPVNEIIIFNTIIKSAMLILFLVLAINQFNRFQILLSSYSDSYLNWEKTKDYIIVHHVYSDPSIPYDPFSKDELEKNRKLYLFFNSKGAILASFDNYDPNNYAINSKNLREPFKVEFAIVNPNFLLSNKVLGNDGSQIHIAESENSMVLLVPDKYKSQKTEIEKYYKDIYNLKSNQNLKILWMKNGQKIFTYSLNINPNNGNCVNDPILRILTQSNGSKNEYNLVAATTGDPFKIKVSDPQNPVESVLKEFRKYYDLSKFNFQMSIIYDFVQAELESIKNELRYTFTIELLICMLIISIIFQNIINYFEQNRIRFAIQRFHGYKFIDRYKYYFFGLIISWLFVFGISLLILKTINVLLVSSILLVLEFIVSVFILKLIETKKTILVTKGG